MTLMRIVAAGDAVLVAEFDERIDPALNARVVRMADAIRHDAVPGVGDVVPTFRSVAVYFDPLQTDIERLVSRMTAAANDAGATPPREPRHHAIPVCYGGDVGPDLDDVARFAGMSASEVVALHSSTDYRVFMLGFMPGFGYLGSVDPRIAAPRRVSPRVRVAAGSVGIAGAQTGVYPRQTPAGWNIIGRSPRVMYALERAEPSLLRAGDTVRFEAIDRAHFDRLASQTSSAS
jgi:KipI family sensor histidine kinase inhibitor